jgi:uncharacterized secreted protein with C-terminal beta-propeller domain
MKKLAAITTSLFFLVAAGCGSGSGSDNGPEPEAFGLLRPVTDAADFEASIKAGLTAIATEERMAIAGAAADGNYTGTYTQEADVDEFDVVRYDGEHLFVAPQRFFHCCYIQATDTMPAGDPAPEPERAVRILATDPASGTATAVGSIALEDDVSVQGMYLDADRMFALTGQAIYGSYGDFWADLAIWIPEALGFRTYDVSDPANPVLEVEASIDGIFVDSRRVGNTVYIVSRYTPNVEGLHYYIATAQQQAENQAILADVTLGELLPTITINGQTQALVTPESCFVANDAMAPDYPVITSVTAVPLDDPSAFESICYNEDAYGVYVSETALYFTALRHVDALQRDITRIHKFAMAGTQVTYRGSAEIDGVVWRGGQADFRMSEHNGDLRALASVFDWGSDDFVDHHLYILRESVSEPVLETISTLPNSNRPQEIGKPNEALFGVRFLGDTAYAVTFEVIDPLYAIDISDPADPFIAGELEVAGFSDFLHPVNDELLLGLGGGANGGVKLELFDVSNLAQPLSRGSVTIGGPGTWSAALYDRYNFTYQVDGAPDVDRFTIPIDVFDDGAGQPLGSALHLFEIRGKAEPALATLSEVGVINPTALDPNNFQWSLRSRAFIHDDTVFYVRDESVWTAFWHTPSIVNGPY